MNHSLKLIDIHEALVSDITAIGAKSGYQRKAENSRNTPSASIPPVDALILWIIPSPINTYKYLYS